jgi:hypothetical protein
MPLDSKQANERIQNAALPAGALESRGKGFRQDQQVPYAFTIAAHMEVFASCGTRVGEVDHCEGKMIKLARSHAQAAGKHHSIPLNWVDHVDVDQHVHLARSSEEVMRQWETEPSEHPVAR